MVNSIQGVCTPLPPRQADGELAEARWRHLHSHPLCAGHRGQEGEGRKGGQKVKPSQATSGATHPPSAG